MGAACGCGEVPVDPALARKNQLQRRQIPNWRLIQSRVPAGRSLKHRTQRAEIFDEICDSFELPSRSNGGGGGESVREGGGIASLEQLLQRLPDILDLPDGYDAEVAIREAFKAVTSRQGGAAKTALLAKKKPKQKRHMRGRPPPPAARKVPAQSAAGSAAAVAPPCDAGAMPAEDDDEPVENGDAAAPAAVAPMVDDDDDDNNNSKSDVADAPVSENSSSVRSQIQPRKAEEDDAAVGVPAESDGAPVQVTGLDEELFWRFCCWLNTYFGVWSIFSFNADADLVRFNRDELAEFNVPNNKFAKYLTADKATAPCADMDSVFAGAVALVPPGEENEYWVRAPGEAAEANRRGHNPLAGAPRPPNENGNPASKGPKVSFHEVAMFILDCQFDHLVFEPTQLK